MTPPGTLYVFNGNLIGYADLGEDSAFDEPVVVMDALYFGLRQTPNGHEALTWRSPDPMDWKDEIVIKVGTMWAVGPRLQAEYNEARKNLRQVMGVDRVAISTQMPKGSVTQ